MKASLCICVQYGEPFDRTVKYVKHFDLFKCRQTMFHVKQLKLIHKATGDK